ncbi:MAG TPA: hypothetical protein VN698_03370 [Bacteroidia bacterium]|nr:hypothetical protein [Bacteroidia bacterium]
MTDELLLSEAAKQHKLNVANRGFYHSMNDKEFAIDVILPARHGTLISKILQSIRNVLQPEALSSQDLILITLTTEFLNLLEDNLRFKNDVKVLLNELTAYQQTQLIEALNDEEILEICTNIIMKNEDYFKGKLAKTHLATNILTKAIQSKNTSNS